MKIKKILISLLIILTSSVGLLFGCTSNNLKLKVKFGEDIVNSIELKLPIDNLGVDSENHDGTENPSINPENPDDPENPETEPEVDGNEEVDSDEENSDETPKDESKALIKIVSENTNEIFKKGLDVTYSENNIVKAVLKEAKEDGYIYEISALYPKNVKVTFTTKDQKVSTSLDVVVTQDLNKIEANILAKNYVVLGEEKEISTNIINFIPSTTTNRNITFELNDAIGYQGVMIENNRIVFTDSIVTYNGVKTDKLYVNAFHQKYAETLDETKVNYIVERIEFDILAPLNDLVILVDGTSVDSLDFATNSNLESLNYKTIEVKQKGEQENTYLDIDSSYEVKYCFIDDKNDVVSVEQNGNTFVISQNFRDDECTMVFYAQNKIQPTSEIKLKEVKVVVRTNPSYLTVNGERQPGEIILYDNGMMEELEILVGPSNSYNKNFILTSLNEQYIDLTYENGTTVSYNDIIASGTKLYVKHSGLPLANPTFNTASMSIQAQADNRIESLIVFRIVESLKYEDVLINSKIETNFSVPKIDLNGDYQTSTFTITATDNNLYIPNFTIDIENENIVSLVNVNYNASPKTFALKSITTGTTTVTINFENGLKKDIEVAVYMPVNSFKIDVEESYKTNLGEIVYRDGELDSLVLKINKTAKLIIKAYDSAGHLIGGDNIYSINYAVSGGNGFIAVSNLNNIITAIRETSSKITVTATITTLNQNGETQIHTKIFDVAVYIPIEKVTISESYFSLYTKNDLGVKDENLSVASIEFNIEPRNATALTSSASSFQKPSATLNFDRTEAAFEEVSNLTSSGLTLTFTALSLDKVQSYIGTITFNVQEFGIVYNKKATIKITKPVTPEKILLDNISTVIDDNGNSSEYLYFNLGYSSNLRLNPRVYPLDSYSLNYVVEISEQTTFGDPIKFDKLTGEISPISAGECIIQFTPEGVTEANKLQATRTIKIVVADGSEEYPYKISTREEFLSLSSTNIVTDIDNQNSKYTKHYRLINDIDLSGVEILPIGMYITKQVNTTQNLYNFKEFTGSFDGEFSIGNVSKSCTISGISIVKDFGDLNIFVNNNNIHLGLFGINSGTIKNLNIHYSNIDLIGSVIAYLQTSVSTNSRNNEISFYFGGVAGINNKNIENCQVNLYSGNITTYFKENYIGLITGKNTNNTWKEDIVNFVANIKDSKVCGTLNVLDGVGKYNFDFPANAQSNLKNILAGGIAGVNEGEIQENFYIYNQDLEIFNKDKIASTIKLTSIYNNNLLQLSENSGFGGIVGLNIGTIGSYNVSSKSDSGLSSFGYISAYNNVGGIAGINKGNIYSSFTASTIIGNSNVGGLVGNNIGGIISNNAVMFLSDGTINPKIQGEDFVGGLIGKNNSFNGTKNFVKSYLSKDGYYDIIINSDSNNYGALYFGDTYTIVSEQDNMQIATDKNLDNKNFANYILKTNDKVIYYDGKAEGVGIIAPEDIVVKINSSNLNSDTIGTFNKFIKSTEDENTIILYYYSDSSLNEYLLNTILAQTPVYPTGTQLTQQLSLIQIESLNKDIITTNDLGKLIVNKTGDAQIKIYSMLNENAFKIINVKVIDAIPSLNLYLDSLSPSLNGEEQEKIGDSQPIKKGESINLYFDDFVKQEDIYIEYLTNTEDAAMLDINLGASYETFTSSNNIVHSLYKTVNAQVIKGKISGTIKVVAKLYVKYFDNVSGEFKFAELPVLKEFNLNIKEGLKNIYTDIQEATLVMSSSIDTQIVIDTDLLTNTNIHIEQISKDNTVDYLNIISDKFTENNLLKYNLKISLDKNKFTNEIINSVITLKIYAYDSIVDLNTIKENENGEYSKHIKIINIRIEENNLINLNMSYFADGEVVKDEYGNDVINNAELESNFIKIGKIGILKINVYPIENLSSLTISYTNSDNLNLNFKQVKKVGQSYEDVNTAQIINKGIILDVTKTNIDENYVYLKLLTDSPIKEGSLFVIKAKVNNLPYYFEKPLTSKLATNLELSYKGAVLNYNGVLEGVYAKGVQDTQVLSLRVSKLNGEYHPVIVSRGNNSPNLKLLNMQQVSNEEYIYNFIFEGLNVSGKQECVELYFYSDKVVNGKTERYISNTLKLNVVDFVVNSAHIENVSDGYLTKPYGTSYELKVKLNTTNNPSSDVINQIAELENTISKSKNTWFFNNEKLILKNYNDFEINKSNNYFVVVPKAIFKGYNLSANFAIEYEDGKVKFKELSLQNSKNEPYIENGKYSNKFRENFGLNFYLQTDINNPVPVYTQQDFVEMKSNANYILMNDLTLENYSIQDATFKSLDGNGYTVKLKSLNLDLSNVKEEFNFGLFGEVAESAQIKNLNIKYDLEFTLDNDLVNAAGINLLNISNLNFGTLAAVNNGLIYNSYVLPYVYNNAYDVLGINVSNILNGIQTKAYIGGLVGVNNGIITNSRSEIKLEVNKGYVAGFVSNNTGTISSCYYKNALITNLGEDEATSTTAGFVNTNSGIIKYSYVEGEENTNKEGQILSNSIISDYCITSSTGVGGFVYANEGDIEDSYSNLSITSQSFSGGFVYTNSGSISRCYSACLNERDSDAHAPFIATKVDIDERKMKELLVDCFYLDANKSSINDNLVTKLTLRQMNEEYYLTNFVVNLDSGIWKFRDGLTPTLIEPNNIAHSQRRLYSSYVDGEGSTIYNYVYENYYAGHEKNPIIISNEEEFINYFTLSSQIKRNTYYYRLVNNINFSEYSNLPTINYIFSGRLDGNGLEISNLSISAPSDFAGNSFGLFASIQGVKNNVKPVIKNLTIIPLEVYANNVQKVGTLAGNIVDADIINVNVDASGVIVQGRNMVGGVVGEITGNSKIINVTSSLSVNASFANSGVGTFIYDCEEEENNLYKINEKVSYAGSICGVINTTKTTDNNENIRNITVLKGVKSIAEISGLAFGLICDDSGVDNIKVYVDDTNYINSLYSAGLVVGENRGYISRAETIYFSNANKDTSLFKNIGFAIGGIVGFNNNGIIVNSIARVSVIAGNNRTIVAGGVVGMAVGGSISSVIATNKVYSNKLIGGIIGLTASRDMITDVATNQDYYISLARPENPDYKDGNNAIKNNSIIYISNTVALNHFNSENLTNRIMGAIIGGAHNSINKDVLGASLTIKNSYITENNYFMPLKHIVKTTEIIGGKTEEIEEIYTLKDFGASNYLKVDGTGSIIKENKNTDQIENKDLYCAEEITKDVLKDNTKALFQRFSNNIFTNTSADLFNGQAVSRTSINEELLPQIKNINNINTRSLEGDGTFLNPYEVNSVSALNQLAKVVDNGSNGIYINLSDNLEVTGKDVLSIGANNYSFNGNFNGNNKFINGLTYLNDSDKYSTQNFFGLFGVIGANGLVTNVNIVANFVINYGSNVNYTGAIAGINNGLISNSNVYGGIVGMLKNVNNNALTYVGGIAGMNSGYANTGIANCNNYSIIYISVLEDGENSKVLENINIYAGFITGANANGAIINRSNNMATSNIDLNSGAGNYTLIVINSDNASSKNCNNYIGNMCGYSQNSNNVTEGESGIGNIYSKALKTNTFIGRVLG